MFFKGADITLTSATRCDVDHSQKPRLFATGIAPLGIVAVGVVPMGVVAVGVVPMGVVSLGAVGMGLLSAAAVNMGVITAGITTMGVAWCGVVGMGPIQLGTQPTLTGQSPHHAGGVAVERVKTQKHLHHHTGH